MAYPIWNTPAGNLGIVPQAEYYEYVLDASDASGGQLKYTHLSGSLPPGLEVSTQGKLQGVPISTAGSDFNQTYDFTVRVQNLSTQGVSDRTFSLTITNIAPPVIVPPPPFDLGEYFDGQVVNLQLQATEFILGGNLQWQLKDGELPPGLSISSNGVIYGYIKVVPPPNGIGAVLGWDQSEWDEAYVYANTAGVLGWDFPLGTQAMHYTFTVEVSDGSNSDTATYRIYVVPRLALTADSSFTTADTTVVNGVKFTVDAGNRHVPIIVSLTDDIPAARQGTWFTYHISAVDLDGDVLQYFVPQLSNGAYDEQIVSNQAAYLGRSYVTRGNIAVGTRYVGNTTPYLLTGTQIQVLSPYFDVGTYETSYVWYNATVNRHGSMRLRGNTRVSANVGDYISQAVFGANATVTSVTAATGTILLAGQLLKTTININGDLIYSANVGDIVTQSGSSGNMTVTANVRLSGQVTGTMNSGVFALGSVGGNIRVNGIASNSAPVSFSYTAVDVDVRAKFGDVFTQPSTGATATVIASHNNFDSNISNPFLYRVQFTNGNTFVADSGNITVNGTSQRTYPTQIYAECDVGYVYNGTGYFILMHPYSTGWVYVAGKNTFAKPSEFLTVGVDLYGVPNVQGDVGFDGGRYDQGQLVLPGSLQLNANSGWITGYLPYQVPAEKTYTFEAQVFKRDYHEYTTSRFFNIKVLGDLYNRVEWTTPTYLGTIETGQVSELTLHAASSEGKAVYYYYTPDTYCNQVQGLRLQSDGLISGRVSFQLFSLDVALPTATTFDADRISGAPTTTFDNTFEFTVTAETYDQSASADRRFTVLVRPRSTKPYDNLYLKALLEPPQRKQFQRILANSDVFPPQNIYRATDPWFGVAKDIRTLFIPGLTSDTASQWYTVLGTNHFHKRVLFNHVRTAVAREDGVYDVMDNLTGLKIGTYNAYIQQFLPSSYNNGFVAGNTVPNGTTVGEQTIKYEVVYVDLIDDNTNALGVATANELDLTNQLQTPYFDSQGQAHTVAYPNSFVNMLDVVTTGIGVQDRGVLPDWMTSVQRNGTQLGFVKALVLAYCLPNTADAMAWRLQQQQVNLNELDWVSDRYYLDQILARNYDYDTQAFIHSHETTFDRYPPLVSAFKKVGTVDYAVLQAFEDINGRPVSSINRDGGMDGITYFRDGETLVFYNQQFTYGIDISKIQDQGWARAQAAWDDTAVTTAEWDFNSAIGWDSSSYVPGYQQWLGSRHTVDGTVLYNTPNQRVGIWQIHINDSYVTLSLANVTVGVRGVTANSTGYGSNVVVDNTDNLFRGMPIRGTGLTSDAVIFDINGINIYVYPAVGPVVSSTWTAMPTPNYNDVLYVRNGFTYGGTNIYYDPVLKTNKLVPNYSKIPQQVRTRGTVFDGDGTKFYDYRDSYTQPGVDDTVLPWRQHNVFV
jgi:hypothetical protein